MEKNNNQNTTDENNFVSLINVNKYYEKNVHAVIDFNLNIKKNEFIVFVGPSGCGKSTTLRMIAGLEEISSGELYIDGQYSNNLVSKDRDIAMVFQSYALYPNMTVFDNMAFSLKVRHFPKADIKQRVLEAAKILELEDYLDRKPKALSGGQRQRVALGRAIVRKARLFLMDEPLSNLDAKLRVQMRSKIIDIHNQIDATTIYVTHDQTEAMTMADRIVVMKKGVIQQIGTPFEIYRYPSNMFVASFIGSPAMNFIKSTYSKGTIILPDKKIIELNPNIVEKHDQFYQNRITTLKTQLEEIKTKIDELSKNVTKNNKKSRSHESDIEKLQKEIKTMQSELNNVNDIVHNQSHDIIFGIRPEAIEETTKDKSDFFEAKVEICELLGDEYFIHFTYGNTPILAKVPCKNTLWSKGDKIILRIVRHKIHLFDPASTLTII